MTPMTLEFNKDKEKVEINFLVEKNYLRFNIFDKKHRLSQVSKLKLSQISKIHEAIIVGNQLRKWNTDVRKTNDR